MSPDRNFTDADLDYLADKVISKLEVRWYINVGKGFMKYVWAGVLGVLLYLAATGYKPH